MIIALAFLFIVLNFLYYLAKFQKILILQILMIHFFINYYFMNPLLNRPTNLYHCLNNLQMVNNRPHNYLIYQECIKFVFDTMDLSDVDL